MFLYFDNQGVLKEIISDLPARVGSDNRNKIYVYCEDTNYTGAWYKQEYPNGTTSTETNFYSNLVRTSVPYDAKRNYKYFKDFQLYDFRVYTLTSGNLAQSGLNKATIRLANSNDILALGQITFNVENSVIQNDSAITQSQYDYLIELATKHETISSSLAKNMVVDIDYETDNQYIIAPGTTNWTSIGPYPSSVSGTTDCSLNNLDGSQSKPLYMPSANTTGSTNAGISLATNGNGMGKLLITISDCPNPTEFFVKHSEPQTNEEVEDARFVCVAEMGTSVQFLVNIKQSNVDSNNPIQDLHIYMDKDATIVLDQENENIEPEDRGYTKERFVIEKIQLWQVNTAGRVVLNFLNGNTMSFPDMNYDAYKASIESDLAEAQQWANGGISGTPSATNNAKYYSQKASDYKDLAFSYKEDASTSETNASNSASAADQSSRDAHDSEDNALAYALESEKWATGEAQGVPTQEGDVQYGKSSKDFALKSEGYAIGEQNGVEVVSGTYFQNNAKYFSGQSLANLNTLLAQNFVKDITLTLNQSTYVATLSFYSDTTHNENTLLGTQTIDFPTESSVVGLSYDNDTQSIIFTLRSGEQTSVPIGAIISGLATETYVDGEVNKLKNGTYSVAVLDGDVMVGNHTYAISSLVDVTSGTLYWKNATNSTNATYSLSAGALVVNNVGKGGDTIQSEIDAKIPKANIDTDVPATPSDSNVLSTKAIAKTFARKKGYYDEFTSGLANNLVGKGSAENFEISRGFSGSFVDSNNTWDLSTNIGSQNASWDKIYGGTYVKNQRVNGTTGIQFINTSGSVSDNVLTFTATAQNGSVWYPVTLKANHKYLYIATIKFTATANSQIDVYIRDANGQVIGNSVAYATNTSSAQTLYAIATNSSYSGAGYVTIRDRRTSDWTSIEAKNVMCVDITDWYSAFPSRIPTTPQQFFQAYPIFNGGYVPFDSGSLISVRTDLTMYANGLNQWDEEWEVGNINGSGVNEAGNYVRSTNYISVFPNTSYYFKCTAGYFRFRYYDINKNYIGDKDKNGLGADPNVTRVMPDNCYYVRFAMSSAYGTTYKGDISVNWLGSGTSARRLTYEPYEHWYNLFSFIDSIMYNGTKLFADGMNGTSTGKDYIDFSNKKAVKVIGKVDLGTLDWIYITDYDSNVFTATISTKKNDDYLQLVCTKYVTDTSVYYSLSDKSISSNNNMFDGESRVFIKDSAYTDATTFKNAISGVYLYYELATPIEVDISSLITSNTFFSDDMGVQIIGTYANDTFTPSNVTSIDTAPMDMDIRYFADVEADVRNFASTYLKLANVDSVLNANGYYKMQDLSSEITDVAGLTYDVKSLYKCGNVCTLFVRAKNETGSDIANASTLFTLPTGAFLTYQISIPYLLEYTPKCAIMSTNRVMNMFDAIPNGKIVYFAFTYAIS